MSLILVISIGVCFAAVGFFLATIFSLQRMLTDQQHAEDKLRVSEQRLRAIIDNTTALISVKDTSGRYVLVNRPLARLFGISRLRAEGKSDLDLFPSDIADAFTAHDEGVLESKGPVEFDQTLDHPDGPRSYMAVKFPLCDVAGRPFAICGIFTDVTERERARASRDLIFNLSPDMMAVSAPDGFTKVVNPQFEKTLGWSEEEILTTPWVELIHPDDREACLAEFERLKAGTPIANFENRARCKDGSYRWLSWSIMPEPGGNRFICAARDITDQRTAPRAADGPAGRRVEAAGGRRSPLRIADRRGGGKRADD